MLSRLRSAVRYAVAGLQGPSGIIPLELLPKQSLTLLLRPFCRPDVGMDLICLAGMGSSIVGILVPRGRSAINMAALWWLYTTLKPDDPPMLQDVGFVAIITAASKHLGLAISRWSVACNSVCQKHTAKDFVI